MSVGTTDVSQDASSLASTEFSGCNWVFYYSKQDQKIHFLKAPIIPDDPYTGGIVKSEGMVTISANANGTNPLAVATWVSDGTMHLFYTEEDRSLSNRPNRLCELIYNWSSEVGTTGNGEWRPGTINSKDWRVLTDNQDKWGSGLAALPGLDGGRDHPKVYYVDEQNRITEAWYDSAWSQKIIDSEGWRAKQL